MKTIKYLFIFLLLNSCGLSSDKDNLDNELTNPEIFKHLQLGSDYKNSCLTLNSEVCDRSIPDSDLCKYSLSNDGFPNELIQEKNYFCQYSLTSDIYACPALYYGYYKGNKILGSATLLFYSPSSIPFIRVADADHEYDPFNDIATDYNGLPALTEYQANKVIKMYDVQYETRETSGYDYWNYTWKKEDLVINLYKLKYGEAILMGGKVVNGDAYQVYVTYHYVKEKHKLLELDKTTEEGESIGDNI